MNWLQKSQSESLESGVDIGVNYPVAGSTVNGLRVLEDIDNMSSIGASFLDYEILPDIYEISMSEFSSPEPHNNFYARTDIQHCYSLAEEIRKSGEIMPLIVVVDNEAGPYILEGGHRFVALHLLGATSFPALVVIDKDE